MGLTTADVIGEWMLPFYVDPAQEDEGVSTGVSTIAGTHVLHRYHPVVMHRGRRRAILANGDIHTLSGKPA